MTMPNEELAALKRTHDFMRSILTMRVSDFRKMKKPEFEQWRENAYYCLKHYPADYIIDDLWENRIKHQLD